MDTMTPEAIVLVVFWFLVLLVGLVAWVTRAPKFTGLPRNLTLLQKPDLTYSPTKPLENELPPREPLQTPPNRGATLMELFTRYDAETNPVTRSSLREIIYHRIEDIEDGE